MLGTIRTYRVVPLILAILLLGTTAGISLDMHICQGKLKTFNLIGKAKDCGEMAAKVMSNHCKKAQQSCHKEGILPFEKSCKKGCCDQKSVISQLEIETTCHSPENIEVSPVFVAAFVYSFLYYSGTSTTSGILNFHHPPPLSRDIPVLLQSFLL